MLTMENMDLRTVVQVWNPQDAGEMLAALTEALDLAKVEGFEPDCVYLNKMRLTLVRRTMTDGSQEMDVNFFDGALT